MKRGEVYNARLDPVEGSEQGGTRPVIIVSREAINASSPLVMAVPCTTYRVGRRIYPSQIVIFAPDGGLEADTIALGEQLRTLSKTRLLSLRGTLSNQAMAELNQALLIALDLLVTNST
ncbi:MAG: type II toxin-antitoxin system PemK/MazF family toxin [Cyanosarcina radialis HA8281-LM2]|jgi:mRNA interferase MazF|nr:type II toxin-antitoxin system PemK/MazF family toxin [Cyanosarcina radialis HA8281-LM2]